MQTPLPYPYHELLCPHPPIKQDEHVEGPRLAAARDDRDPQVPSLRVEVSLGVEVPQLQAERHGGAHESDKHVLRGQDRTEQGRVGKDREG